MRPQLFVDLFSGAGGLSLGLEGAGWKSVLAVDNWDDASTTLQDNFPDHQVFTGDIGNLKQQQLRQLVEEHVDWVVGGPPCQGFSTVGKRLRHDPRNGLVREFARVVKILEPDGFLLENVIGLRDMRFEQAVIELFTEIGYRVTAHVVRAVDFGVPQLRRRMFFVGHRDYGYFSGPQPTHGPRNYVTVWDAIGDLPEVGPGETATSYTNEPYTTFQMLMRLGATVLQGHTVSRHPADLVRAISFIPDGGNRQSIPPEYQPASGFHNSYSRLSSKAPAVAVTSNMGKPSATRCIHPFQDRGLTAREGARLQSFPDRFHFHGGIVSQRLQIANAVPPLLATSIGCALLQDELWSSSHPAPLDVQSEVFKTLELPILA